MRVEQKVHERGFLCNEQDRLKFFSEMAKYFLAKALAKVHVDMCNFRL